MTVPIKLNNRSLKAVRRFKCKKFILIPYKKKLVSKELSATIREIDICRRLETCKNIISNGRQACFHIKAKP